MQALLMQATDSWTVWGTIASIIGAILGAIAIGVAIKIYRLQKEASNKITKLQNSITANSLQRIAARYREVGRTIKALTDGFEEQRSMVDKNNIIQTYIINRQWIFAGAAETINGELQRLSDHIPRIMWDGIDSIRKRIEDDFIHKEDKPITITDPDSWLFTNKEFASSLLEASQQIRNYVDEKLR